MLSARPIAKENQFRRMTFSVVVVVEGMFQYYQEYSLEGEEMHMYSKGSFVSGLTGATKNRCEENERYVHAHTHMRMRID